MCTGEEEAFRKVITMEPEIKFSQEEYGQLMSIVDGHDRQYKSVNFGERLIKEMIMCR